MSRAYVPSRRKRSIQESKEMPGTRGLTARKSKLEHAGVSEMVDQNRPFVTIQFVGQG